MKLLVLPVLMAALFSDLAFAHAQPASTSQTSAPIQFRSVLPRLHLSEVQKAELSKSLAGQHKQYDPVEKMLARPFSSPGYHTTLKGGTVHPTREAANYAVALLDTGDKELEARAIEVLRRVISLQDTDPNSKTYGIWSWFLEEPLAQMAPPDWNWADFIGTQLLQVAINHRDRLPPDLQVLLDAAIVHAARSIQKRNVGPGYTNIAIMGAYVTLVASDIYNNPDLRQYAHQRLAKFAEHTRKNGGFSEYNSPTYTIVALEELARLKMHTRDPEAKKIVDEMYHVAWQEIAEHFHAPSGQWAGPHSRAYRTLLGDGHARLIQRSLKNEIDARLPLPLPDDLRAHFGPLGQAKTLQKTFTRGEAGKSADLIGTTYLHPQFALGSINWGEMWNQRRPLVAYWGTKEKPSSLQMRFLHDGYDFSDAQFFSVQKEGRVLAALVLATDGGDTHISLDRIKNATIKAKDLRLRFEIGGAASSSTWQVPQVLGAPAVVTLDGLTLQAAVPHARLGAESGRWEAGRGKDLLLLDLVLFESAEEKEIKISDLEEAALSIAVQIAVGDKSFDAPHAQSSDGMLRATWGELQLAIPNKPAKVSELRARVATQMVK